MDFNSLTIKELHAGLVTKKFSALELCQFYLQRIQANDKKIGAFLQVGGDSALKQAGAIDNLIARKENLGALAGIPVAIKDNMMVKGLNCTCGSKILENYVAPFDATCIKKLKEQGAVILGKTNLDEFAMGSSTERSAFRATKNPVDTTRVPGGSSGGSTAAVASNECAFALGSDTGGSIRQPASFCGVVGLKPTYGTVSRYGLVAFASSLDQIGPLTKKVEDAEIVFEAIAGKDAKDSTSVDKQVTHRSVESLKGLKIGIPKEYFAEGIERGTREAVETIIKKIEREGAEIVEISLPHTKYALPCYYIVATSEASANLARFDGIRYGLSTRGKGIKDLLNIYLKSRGQGFGPEVKRRIMLGTFVLSSGYYDAYYTRAQKVRTMIKQDFTNAFSIVDFILTPVSPFTAFKFGEKIEDPLKMYLSDIYTISVNLAGLPAISLPCGQSEGLPVGLQIIAKPFDEAGIFSLGKFIENLVKP
ncbi:MAG: Asp-tRNA(Asn)/Glu-tRNA(Gln) amidotransferase subunit GatA [Candidatus Pacebacteria bacterium]|nr:Asp-tRNA(Asn)/Glu-tRNA(Gln) amidotransferase subunit GatA [Candidatus Paceibacterota bacterium]